MYGTPKASGMRLKSSDAVCLYAVRTESSPKWAANAARTVSVTAASLLVRGN